jgi:hypothetical protein
LSLVTTGAQTLFKKFESASNMKVVEDDHCKKLRLKVADYQAIMEK